MKCPSSADLRAFISGELEAETFADVLTHIGICTACDTVVDELLAEEVPLLYDQPPEGVEPLSEEDCAVNFDAIKLELGRQCLTPRLLNAYCRDELNAVSHRWVENHLRTCDSCCEQVAGWWRRVQGRLLLAIFGPDKDDDGRGNGECTADGGS